MSTQPEVLVWGMAGGEALDERTFRVLFPGATDDKGVPLGAFLHLAATQSDSPSISIYHVDRGVRVVVANGVELVQNGMTGCVVERSDLVELLGAAVLGVASAWREMDDIDVRIAVQRYAPSLPVEARLQVAADIDAMLRQQRLAGVSTDNPDYSAWVSLCAKLEDV